MNARHYQQNHLHQDQHTNLKPQDEVYLVDYVLNGIALVSCGLAVLLPHILERTDFILHFNFI